MMAIPFWAGLFWRRASAAAAWWSTLVSFGVLLFTSQIRLWDDIVLWDFNATFADSLPAFLLFEGKLLLPWQMIFYLTAGFVSVIVVSFFTRRVEEDKLDKFYTCLRTPVTPGEPETAPFTLPPGVEPGPRRPLFKHADLEIPKPTVVGMVGFFAGWVAVGALIWVFFWILGGG